MKYGLVTPIFAAFLCMASAAAAQQAPIPDTTKRGDDVTFDVPIGGTSTIGVLLHPNKHTVLHVQAGITESQEPNFPALEFAQTPNRITLRPEALPDDKDILGNFMVETPNGKLLILMFPSPSLKDANSIVRINTVGAVAVWNAAIAAAAAQRCGEAYKDFDAQLAAVNAKHQREMEDQRLLAALEGAVGNDGEIPIPDAQTHAPPGVQIRSVVWKGTDRRPFLVLRFTVANDVGFTPRRFAVSHPTWTKPRKAKFGLFVDGQKLTRRAAPGEVVELVADLTWAPHWDDLRVVVAPTTGAEPIIASGIESRSRLSARASSAKVSAVLHVGLGFGAASQSDAENGPVGVMRAGYSLTEHVVAESSIRFSADQPIVFIGVAGMVPRKLTPVMRIGIGSRLADTTQPAWFFGGGMLVSIWGSVAVGVDATQTREGSQAVTDVMAYVARDWEF